MKLLQNKKFNPYFLLYLIKKNCVAIIELMSCRRKDNVFSVVSKSTFLTLSSSNIYLYNSAKYIDILYLFYPNDEYEEDQFMINKLC